MGTGNARFVRECEDSEVRYLDREKNTVWLIENGQAKSVSFEGIIEFYKESAVLCVSNSEFILAGGVKASGNLTKKVIKVNFLLKSVKKLTSLPAKTCSGTLIIHKNIIYLCGAVIKRETQVPCPLLSLNLESGKWDGLGINDLLIKPNYSLTNILKPKSCTVNNKIYFFGGIKFNTQKPTKKIFSINLGQTMPEYQIESFECPLKFINLACCVFEEHFFICGQGADKNLYLLKKPLKSGEWIKIATIHEHIIEDYPILLTTKNLIFFSFPLFSILKNQNLVTFDFQKNLINEEEKLEKAEKKPSIKHPRISEKSSKNHKKRFKSQLSTHYSKSTAPMLPSNIIKQNTFISSSSSSSSSNSNSSSYSSLSSSSSSS